MLCAPLPGMTDRCAICVRECRYVALFVLTAACVLATANRTALAAAPSTTTQATQATQSASAPAESESTSRPITVPASRPTPDSNQVLGQAKKRRGSLWDSHKFASDGDRGDVLWQMLAYVVVILVIGGAAIVLTKKLRPRIGGRSQEVSVLETVYLGPRKAIHLVRVGDQRFLLGGSREKISMLAEVSAAFPDVLKSRLEAGDAAAAEQAETGST